MEKIIKPETSQQDVVFTICTLHYGDYPDLARRCLESIVALPDASKLELRILANEPSPRLEQYLRSVFEAQSDRLPYITLTIRAQNKGKYPVMREALHGEDTIPVNACLPKGKYVMWFDDDSYIKTPTSEWLAELKSVMTTTDMCGQLMTVKMQGNQHHWIRQQPWYSGLPFVRGQAAASEVNYIIPAFAVGGWWCADYQMLKQLNWPPKNIIHRGGDYMLGEAVRQNGYRLKHWRKGVVINADATDKDASSPRRGWNPTPVGVDYELQLTTILHDATREVPPALLDYPNM